MYVEEKHRDVLSCCFIASCSGQVAVPRAASSFGAGAPKQRTQQQMERLASHMRYCKLRKTAAKLGVLLAEKQSKESLGKRYKLSAKDMCTIAFSCSHRRTMLADRFDVSKQTIRRVLTFMSSVVMDIQVRQLQEFRDYALEHPPHVACATLSWDETSQTLALQTPLDATYAVPQQASSAWPVLVCRLQLAVGWRTGLKLYKEFIMPPLPLSSNSSSNLFCAMFRHPLTQPIMELLEQIVKVSSVSCWLHETDGHLANEKLHYHLYAKRMLPTAGPEPAPGPAAPVSDQGTPPKKKLPTLTEQVLCQNHQVQLTIVSAVDAMERVSGLSKMVPGLYCGTLFLRMGGHFVRLLASVPSLVRDVAYFRWVAVPTEEDNSGRRYAEELGEYLVANLRHNSRQMSSTARGGPVRLVRLVSRLKQALRLRFHLILN